MSLSPSRQVAYDVFHSVMFENREVRASFDYQLKKTKLKPKDKSLAYEIIQGSLRWYSKIQWILQNIATRDLDGTSSFVQTALVCGTYQIFYLSRVPDRATVNESVEYLKSKKLLKATGFVNGILRQVASKSKYFPKPDKKKKPAEYLALQFSHPKWIVDRWLARFSFERLETILAAHNGPQPYHVRINLKRTSLEAAPELQKNLLKNERTPSKKRPLRTCLELEKFPKTGPDSLFDQGYFAIQGESSQLSAQLVDTEGEPEILDACCGPGGKSGAIFERMNEGSKLLAIDPAESQIKRFHANLGLLGHVPNKQIEVLQSTLEDLDAKRTFDRILIDAPCSGLGTLRQHPEGKWRKKPGCVGKFAEQQRSLLTEGLKRLKKGGELVYSVCSFEPEESTDHLDWLMDSYADKLEVVSPLDRIPSYYRKYVTRKHVLLLYSGNDDGLGGFSSFVVRCK